MDSEIVDNMVDSAIRSREGSLERLNSEISHFSRNLADLCDERASILDEIDELKRFKEKNQ